MEYTESHFGLENHDGKITANGGVSYLPECMTQDEFDQLVTDIEHWKERLLTIREIQDLAEITG